MRSFHGLDVEWTIPPLRTEAVRRMYAKIEADLQVILDGTEVTWDGSNTVGRRNAAADAAYERIESYVEGGWYSSDVWAPWDARDWLCDTGIEELGLTAQSTPEEIREAAELEVERADVVLDADDLERYLAECCADAQEGEDGDEK